MKEFKRAFLCDKMHVTITVDADEGLTPAAILCPVCNSVASEHHNINQENDEIVPTHEFYKPAHREFLNIYSSKSGIEFNEAKTLVKNGGLLLRNIIRPAQVA